MNDHRLDALRRFAYWLDEAFRVPGTRLRVGLDPILGLVPGLGDMAGAIMGVWILVEAAGLGASRATLVRMAVNIGIDALVGAVPLLGDLFDVGWKANRRNLELLDRHAADARGARTSDRAFVIALAGVVLGLAAALLVGVVALGAWLGRMMRG